MRAGVLRYLAYRLIMIIPTMLAITFIVFFMIHLIPGDPIRAIAGLNASPEDIERIKRELGWYDPIPIQYARWLLRTLRGDLGVSIRTGKSVAEVISSTLPKTFELAVISMIFAVAFGIGLGTIAAYRKGTAIDTATIILSLLGASIPQFLIGLILIYIFGLKLEWLPTVGRLGPVYSWEGFKSILMPAITLGAYSAGLLARLTRTSMVKVLESLYITYARSKGLPQNVVLMRHGLRNALIPIVTVIGIQFGFLMGGAVIVETIFAWPGIGKQLVDAIISRDFPLVQGIVLVYTVIFIVINLVVDVLYAVIDPRVELR